MSKSVNILFIVVLLTVQYSHCSTVRSLDMNTLQDVEKLRKDFRLDQLEEKFEVFCSGHRDQLKNVLQEVKQCIDTNVDFYSMTRCTAMQVSMEKCSQPTVDLLRECLPERSKLIPSMLMNMFLATRKFVCETDGEHILEFLNPCVMNVTAKTQRCIRQLRTKLEELVRRSRSIYLSAAEACELIESVRPCLQTQLNLACGNRITRESFMQYYDYVTNVCKSYHVKHIK